MSHVVLRQLLRELHTKEHFYKTPGVFKRPKVGVMFTWWCWDPYNPYLELNELSSDVSYISVPQLLVKILRFWVLQFLLSWAGFVLRTLTKSNSNHPETCAYISWKFGVPTLRSLGEIACESFVTLSQKNKKIGEKILSKNNKFVVFSTHKFN